jgi:hypothetical protein
VTTIPELRPISYRVATTTLPLLVTGEAIRRPAPWQDIRLCVRVQGAWGPLSEPAFRRARRWVIDHYATGRALTQRVRLTGTKAGALRALLAFLRRATPEDLAAMRRKA